MGNRVSVTLDTGELIELSHGETLGDLQVAYGEGILRNTTNPNAVIAARSVKIPNGNYDYVRKKVVRPVYVVSAIVRGGFSCKGARGNIYKLLERHQGWYSLAEGRMVAYSGNDLQLKAYFYLLEKACDFQTQLNDWEMHKELVNLDGITTETPVTARMPEDLARFLLSEYNPSDFESPCNTLDELKSYHWSVPLTETIEDNSPLAVYQSLDRRMAKIKHIKCHLHDKAKNKKLQNDENNMIAASWPFHQMMDGLALTENIPLLRLSFVSASDHTFAEKDSRYSVTVGIEFRDAASAGNYQADGAARVDNLNWTTTVYVKDKEIFISCLEWKHNNTTKAWDDYDAAVGS